MCKSTIAEGTCNGHRECLSAGKMTKASGEARCKQGQCQYFQSDFLRSGCLKSPHAECERTIHHDNASLHDPSGLLRSMARPSIRRTADCRDNKRAGPTNSELSVDV